MSWSYPSISVSHLEKVIFFLHGNKCFFFVCSETKIIFGVNEPALSKFNLFQPFPIIFNRFSTNSTAYNCFQTCSTLFKHFQPFSTFFNRFSRFQRFSFIFICLSPFFFNVFNRFALVLLSATAEKVSVSCMRDFVHVSKNVSFIL